MWTDVGLGFGGPKDWEDIDYKLSYLMDTYDIVSLEKCLFEGNNDQNTVSLPPTRLAPLAPHLAQEGHFLEVTSRMHSLRPESQTKVLYYWAFTAVRCYKSVKRCACHCWPPRRSPTQAAGATRDVAEGLHRKPRHGRPLQHTPVGLQDRGGQADVDTRSAGCSLGVPLVSPGALGPVTASAGGAGGVFLDGTHWLPLAGCKHKTCGESKVLAGW